jgi:hypothetical protein
MKIVFIFFSQTCFIHIKLKIKIINKIFKKKLHCIYKKKYQKITAQSEISNIKVTFKYKNCLTRKKRNTAKKQDSANFRK